MTRTRGKLLLVGGLVYALMTSSAWAVRTKTWHIDQPADFLAGTLENIALTSRAELLLAPQVQRFGLDPKDTDTVNCLAVSPDGIPYLGTGPKGIIYRINDNKIERVADLPEGQVFSLLFLPDKTMLAGVGGGRGAIYRVDPAGQTSVFWQGTGVRYVWSMVRDDQGNIYAATGSDGDIYRLSTDGRNATRLAHLSNTQNVLTLAMAGADRLVFGTDSTGLIGAINTRTAKLRILYDAGERSITSIVAQPDGSVYVAATRSSADKASAGNPPARPQGRPDHDGTVGPSATSRRSLSAGLVGSATNPSQDRQQGAQNTIYRIDPNGLTTETVMLSPMLLGLAAEDDNLLVGTGNPGRIYRLEPSQERYISLLREDASYFTAIARAGSVVWVGASRTAAVLLIKPDYVAAGTFTSSPQDANLLSLWGQIKIGATIPQDTAVLIQTRSSNTHDVTGPGWSEWSTPVTILGGDRPLIASPPGRFLQVRLTLKTDPNGRRTPTVRSIDVPYLTFNLPPEITSVSVTTPSIVSKRPSSGEEWYEADSNIEIEWQGRDPNGDTLSYDVYVRPVGAAKWTRIARNQTKTSYTWDSQDMADGLYELRVVASDAPDNPPNLAQSRARISEPFIINKTAPKIESVRIHPVGSRVFQVEARLTDKLSNIFAAQYSLDSSSEWTPLLPIDGIFDSPEESLSFEIGPLSEGEHVLSIRAVDERGNVGRTQRTVAVEE